MNLHPLKIMRTKFIAIALLTSVNLFGQTQSVFVTLTNGEFRLDGEPFYPIVMNYPVEVKTLNGNRFVGPAGGEHQSYLGNCQNAQECAYEIESDMSKIKDMGFNTIRIALRLRYWVPAHPDSPSLSDYHYQVPCELDNGQYEGFAFEAYGQGEWWYRDYQKMLPPYDMTDPGSAEYYGYIFSLLGIAQQVGLKVILIACNAPRLWHNPPAADNPYPLYLAQLATVLQGHEALMAYDLYNEPNLFWGEFWQGNDPHPCWPIPPGTHFLGTHPDPQNWNKQNFCEYTSFWYDALKANDPNHLVTIGPNQNESILNWDPLILKVDFISIHIYPVGDEGEGYQAGPTYERYKGWLHWYHKHCSKPWIIGETGFSGVDGRTVDAVPSDYVYGDQAQQAEFAYNSMRDMWNCGGSGYSWWAYRDGDGANAPNAPGSTPYYWGLISAFSDENDPASEKPAAQVFRNYKPYLEARQGCPQPDNYYNPFNRPSNDFEVTMQLLDQNGVPVQDAYIDARDWVPDISAPNEAYFEVANYTFTNEVGQFSLTPAPDGPNGPTKVAKIRYSAQGGEKRDLFNPNGTFPSVAVLRRVGHAMHSDFVGESIIPASVTGHRTLSIAAILVGPNTTTEFKAAESVHVIDLFHAQTGSDVHIWCDPTPLDCAEFDEIPDFVGRLDGGPLADDQANSEPIILRFILPSSAMKVYPNPSTARFNITVPPCVEPTEAQNWISVLDPMGRSVQSFSAPGFEFILDLNGQADGVFHLTVTTPCGDRHHNTIILQR